MSCIKVGECSRTPACDICMGGKPCPQYITELAVAIKRLKIHMNDYPKRHLCHTVAEADEFWEHLDWWHKKLWAIVVAVEELQK